MPIENLFIIIWMVIRWQPSHISDELEKMILSYIQVDMVQFMFMVEPRNLQVAIVWVLALLFQGLFLHSLTFWCSWISKSSRLFLLYFQLCLLCHDKWVPFTTARCVLRLQVEEQPPVWRVAANILNKQSWTADKGWSSSVGVGRDANNSSP
jgi:hypothetical protein